MKQFLIASLICCSLLGPSVAMARSEEEVREAVNTALTERHPTVTPDWWRSLGSETPRILIAMYRDSQNIYHRIRLLQALAFFPDDTLALEFLKDQAEKSGEDVIRNAAIRGVGVSQGAKEAEFLGKFLKHPDADTRFAAAESLKRTGDASALRKVEEYLAVEKTPWIAEKLNRVNAQLLTKPIAAERVNPEIQGSWSGYWVASAGKSPGMLSRGAKARLQVRENIVEGEISRVVGGKEQTSKLGNASGKDQGFSGELLVQKKPSLLARHFEAELLMTDQGTLLRFWVPDQAGFFILRKLTK